MGLHLPPFDPAKNYKAKRGFRADGSIWERGALIDKSRIGNRELQRLYENHRVDPLTDSEESALADRLAAADDKAARHKPARAAPTIPAAVINADQSLTITPPDAESRIAKLVADNDKDALTKMAEGLEVAPPGNKPELAAAIVAAEDAKALAGGGDAAAS